MPPRRSNEEKADLEGERIAIEWERLRSERKKAAVEFRLRRQELFQRRGWKELLANPLSLAIVGGFLTLMTTIISTHFASSANTDMERLKAQLAAKAEDTKAELSSKAAKQTLQADLIKKFAENPKTDTVRDNLRFLIDAGLLPDYRETINAYLEKYPHSAPQIGSSTTPTVLGGANSVMADWPWLVAVYSSGQFDCNGTLIAPQMVLTTARCVTRGQAIKYEVATITDDVEKGNVRIVRRTPVTKVIVHPAFSSDTSTDSIKNDIAIIELGNTLPGPFATISARISDDPQRAGTIALVAALSFKTSLGSLLQGPMAVTDDAACAARIGDSSASAGIICSGFEGVTSGVCPGTGSAGAPLVLLAAEGQKYQIGIVSRADDCNLRGVIYAAYARISSNADWIAKVVPNVLTVSMTEVRR
jgi:Trypsin